MVVQYVRLQLPQGVNSEDSSVCKVCYMTIRPFDSTPQHLLQIASLICHTFHNNKHYLLQCFYLDYVTLLALVNARKTFNITMLAVD